MTYSNISSHRSMVFDDVRNEVYAQAIRKLVTPDSVVLDLGAGMGILGLIAAAAGAKRVYLVEPEPIVHVAQEIAKVNNLSERIVVLEGRIEEIELPQRVDIIVSVFTGNLLYTEDLLPSLYIARSRYLKPDGWMLPSFAELVLAPVTAPELHAKYIERWSEPSIGLDFSAGRRFAANKILWLNNEELKPRLLAAGSVLSAIDLMKSEDADCNGEVRCRIETAGLCHGLLGWIRIRLDDQWLSTDPASPRVHWSPALLPIDPPLSVEAGEEITIKLQRPVRGDWTWTVKASSGVRRHSTFLARADGPRQLNRMAPNYKAELNDKGKKAFHVLEMMRSGNSNQEIAQSLFKNDQQAFRDVEEALRLVQELASTYAGKG
jgi:SAM-dependent methyltransferase